MYKFIMRNQKGTGHAVFYDEKTSILSWGIGALIEGDNLCMEDLPNDTVRDFVQSIKESRTIQSLDKYFMFMEECLHCPLVHLCKGEPLSNMINFKSECERAYVEQVQNLCIALMYLTRTRLECIEGDIRRPE